MAGTPSGGGTMKTIIIGVLTTVIAYTIVHYFTDRKQKRKEKEKVKKETIEAWKTLIKYEVLSTTNYYAGMCIEDVATQLESLIYEKEQLSKNYALISTKQGIDDDLVSFAGRAVGNTQEIKKILENYLSEYLKINPADPAAGYLYRKTDSLFTRKITMAQDRDRESLQSIYLSLVEKYGDEFKVPEPDNTFTKEGFFGKWKETGIEKTFDFRSTGKFIMTVDNENYSGKWKLSGNSISLDFDDGSGILTMHIRQFHEKFILFSINDESAERHACRL
jgi:hypothetical protein